MAGEGQRRPPRLSPAPNAQPQNRAAPAPAVKHAGVSVPALVCPGEEPLASPRAPRARPRCGCAPAPHRFRARTSIFKKLDNSACHGTAGYRRKSQGSCPASPGPRGPQRHPGGVPGQVPSRGSKTKPRFLLKRGPRAAEGPGTGAHAGGAGCLPGEVS